MVQHLVDEMTLFKTLQLSTLCDYNRLLGYKKNPELNLNQQSPELNPSQ